MPCAASARLGRSALDDDAGRVARALGAIECGREILRRAKPRRRRGCARRAISGDSGRSTARPDGQRSRVEAPGLLDELASRRRLDDEPRRLDERRDEIVLGVVVEAQIGAHLGKRHGLDGGTGDE